MCSACFKVNIRSYLSHTCINPIQNTNKNIRKIQILGIINFFIIRQEYKNYEKIEIDKYI
jgi:hypothetical protein